MDDLVLSQEDKPKTHRSMRQISRETGIHRSSVHRIIHCDLQLKCLKRRRAQQLSEANRVARLTCCKQLLKSYDDSEVDFIWFTDEKAFTVEPPFTSQNDRVYAPVGTKKRFIQPSRLLRTRSTFSKSVMVSVAVSTRSSADADNRLDAFSGQSRSTNMVSFHMLLMVSYCAIVTLSLRRAVFTIFVFKKFHDLEMGSKVTQGH